MIRTLLTICFLLVAGYCLGQRPQQFYISDTNQLASDCRTDVRMLDGAALLKSEQAYDAISCIYTVKAFLDTTELGNGTSSRLARFCTPASMDINEAIRVFLKFIDDHPEKLHEPAVVNLWNSMSHAFPCPK